MTVALRKTIQNTRAFCVWAVAAPAQDFVVYHIGDLVADRIKSPPVHDLAETVLLLQETGFVVGSQLPMRLAGLDGWTYLATRTGMGWAPRHLVNGRITAAQWRALHALRMRESAMSATRTVRDALSVSEAKANAIMDELRDRNWLEPAQVKGWQVSTVGHRVLT